MVKVRFIVRINGLITNELTMIATLPSAFLGNLTLIILKGSDREDCGNDSIDEMKMLPTIKDAIAYLRIPNVHRLRILNQRRLLGATHTKPQQTTGSSIL